MQLILGLIIAFAGIMTFIVWGDQDEDDRRYDDRYYDDEEIY